MARCFENGVVLLNGSSVSPYAFDLAKLFPGEALCRLRGRQDPNHNSGEMMPELIRNGNRARVVSAT